MAKKDFVTIFLLTIMVFTIGCAKTDQVLKENETENLKIVEMKNAKKSDAEIGIVTPILDYASENTLVFHDYFGLFVYTLKNEKIKTNINLKALGFEDIVGDDALVVNFDEDNGKLTLYTLTKETAIEIDINKNEAKTIDVEDVKKAYVPIIKGSLKIGTGELTDLMYKPNSGEKKYFPLKDLK